MTRAISDQIFKVPASFKNANVTKSEYKKLYEESINNPEIFWAKMAREKLTWYKDFTKVKNTSFKKPINVEWFEDGQLNISVNCLDRHLKERPNKIAIIWEGDDPGENISITYKELHSKVCQTANLLKSLGVKKGDRVIVYLPMILEAAYVMLACCRIGAIHSVVFGGFSAEALRNRIIDSNANIVITADESLRGGKKIPLKANVDTALSDPNVKVKNVVVVKRTGSKVEWKDRRDLWFHELFAKENNICEPEIVNAEDPLFILYTSGSTGKPKGVLHTSAGYLLYAAITHYYVFDYHEQDIYWCTADIGWITGHSYIIYGPLANGATTLMFEGIPNYPDYSRYWQIIDKYKVSLFYTAPTVIRSLMRQGDEFVTKTSRKSLRVLGSVGEPINPEAWLWYYNIVGNKTCPIMDTWWQTETGGLMITPMPGVTDLKPGSATQPFFGIKPEIIDTKGNIIEGEGEGALCIKDSWPGQMRTVFGDHDRFYDTYFSQYKGHYFSGDGAIRDKDGYYWITGRLDDIINVSGHRIGTAEVEDALVSHHSVTEAAVVGCQHEIKGQGIYAFVILKNEFQPSNELKNALIKQVRHVIGPVATPDFIQFSPELPKTRSGKIMRRILRKIVENKYDDLGDINTLVNPNIVKELINEYQMLVKIGN